MPVETGLVGRDDLVALVELLIERRTRQPLPIILAYGPGGSGKTAVLHHLQNRHRRAAPVAYVDLDETGSGSVKAILDVAYGRLHGYSHASFGTLRLPRYTLATAALSTVPTAGARSSERARQLIGSQLRGLSRFTEIVSSTGDVAPASAVMLRAMAKLLAPLLRWLVVLAIVTPTPVRRLFTSNGAALRWYEQIAVPGYVPPARNRADDVISELWELAASSNVADRETVDRVLIRAFLDDLRAAYRWQRHRKVNTLLLLDNADLLPGAESRRLTGHGSADFLALLAEAMTADPEVPFFAVATKQATPEHGAAADRAEPEPGPESGSDPAQLEARLLLEAEERYSGWRKDHDSANQATVYLTWKLRPFTLAQTRLLLARRNAYDSKTVETKAMVNHLQDVTHGHPLAVWALYRRNRLRSSLREIYDDGADWGEGVSPRWSRTWGGLLLWRFLHRLEDVEPFETTPGQTEEQGTERTITRRNFLARLAAARELDVSTIRVLTGVDEREARRRLQIIAAFSFTDPVPGGGLRLHPLLRDLLAGQSEPDGDPTYLAVHDRLRAHFDGLPGRAADHLYHCLAIGDTHTVAEHLRQRMEAGDETWLADLLLATQAPAIDQGRRRWRGWIETRIESRIGRRPFDRLAHPELVRTEELVRALWTLRSCTSLAPQHHSLYDNVIGAFRALIQAGQLERSGAVDQRLTDYERDRQSVLDNVAADPSPGLLPLALPALARAYPRVWPPRHFFRRVALLTSVMLVIGYGAVYLIYPTGFCNRPSLLDPGTTIGELLDPGKGLRKVEGQCIGVTARPGAFVADTALNADDREVVKLAELIDAENQRVTSFVQSNQDFKHVTVVVATMLSSGETSGGDQAAGINELRGAYLAQKQWNLLDPKTNPPPVLLRIVLANFGGNSKYAKDVAGQIRALSDRDSTVVAVAGMGQTRLETIEAARALGTSGDGIAMVGSVPSGVSFSKLLYFVRVAPPNDYQAAKMYEFMVAREDMRTRRRYVVVDNDDQYSKELADEFEEQDDKAERMDYNSASPDTTTSLATMVGEICADDPAKSPMIVYTGRTSEFSSLIKALRGADCGQNAMVLGADDLSQLETENFAQLKGDEEFLTGKVFFTTFGPSRAGWESIFPAGIPENVRGFYDAYDRMRREPNVKGQAFRSDTNGHIMAAYDAIGLIMRGVGSDVPVDRETAFQAIRAATPYPGVAGRIVFSQADSAQPDTGADPIEKLIVLQRVVNDNGRLRTEYVSHQGQP